MTDTTKATLFGLALVLAAALLAFYGRWRHDLQLPPIVLPPGTLTTATCPGDMVCVPALRVTCGKPEGCVVNVPSARPDEFTVR